MAMAALPASTITLGFFPESVPEGFVPIHTNLNKESLIKNIHTLKNKNKNLWEMLKKESYITHFEDNTTFSEGSSDWSTLGNSHFSISTPGGR